MRQQRSYPTEAIILKHLNLGEADRVITLFTPRRGKYNVIAKGTRRPVSRKAGHLELLSYSQIQLALGRNFDIVTQAVEREHFAHLRTELWHMTCGIYLAELIDRFIEDTTAHPDVYNLLLESLRFLDLNAAELKRQRREGTVSVGQDHNRTQLLLRYFEIYLLSAVGYEPVLRTCAHCDAEIQPVENGFTPSLGGALCPNCSHLWTRPISMNALKVLRLLQRTAWAHVPYFNLDAHLHSELEAVMYSLLRFHLERDLKAWSFLEMLH
ncbi:MAG: DNA repair protein RecO [Chloroflexi bacterium]|nr:DNA repair protein RecO [Ktedonobacteraceae bacterium]MBV8822888.1 DNA repair protein RecO [Ktedonobacteraceae bacterium]MBV9022102.1 DNA repair protein RecO [Ktedonobacteraceae bacterium]MBV9707802.1 DNA repair protein RecO [Chloroflexota bacterium]